MANLAGIAADLGERIRGTLETDLNELEFTFPPSVEQGIQAVRDSLGPLGSLVPSSGSLVEMGLTELEAIAAQYRPALLETLEQAVDAVGQAETDVLGQLDRLTKLEWLL